MNGNSTPSVYERVTNYCIPEFDSANWSSTIPAYIPIVSDIYYQIQRNRFENRINQNIKSLDNRFISAVRRQEISTKTQDDITKAWEMAEMYKGWNVSMISRLFIMIVAIPMEYMLIGTFYNLFTMIRGMQHSHQHQQGPWGDLTPKMKQVTG